MHEEVQQEILISGSGYYVNEAIAYLLVKTPQVITLQSICGVHAARD